MHSLLSALCTSLLLVTTVANAADNAMLAERHAKRGVACTSCHVKSPNDKPTMTQCLACHGGSYENLAQKPTKATSIRTPPTWANRNVPNAIPATSNLAWYATTATNSPTSRFRKTGLSFPLGEQK